MEVFFDVRTFPLGEANLCRGRKVDSGPRGPGFNPGYLSLWP